ncbi:MAG TPA: hypothetical protein PLC53_03760 [Bacilli bacterium]|nr:hypothetical protein [Bacilli bacterium]
MNNILKKLKIYYVYIKSDSDLRCKSRQEFTINVNGDVFKYTNAIIDYVYEELDEDDEIISVFKSNNFKGFKDTRRKSMYKIVHSVTATDVELDLELHSTSSRDDVDNVLYCIIYDVLTNRKIQFGVLNLIFNSIEIDGKSYPMSALEALYCGCFGLFDYGMVELVFMDNTDGYTQSVYEAEDALYYLENHPLFDIDTLFLFASGCFENVKSTYISWVIDYSRNILADIIFGVFTSVSVSSEVSSYPFVIFIILMTFIRQNDVSFYEAEMLPSLEYLKTLLFKIIDKENIKSLRSSKIAAELEDFETSDDLYIIDSINDEYSMTRKNIDDYDRIIIKKICNINNMML